MSSTTYTAEDLSSLYTTIYCGNAVLAFVVYDWLLCLPQEVECIWRPSGGFNAGSLVYILNRFPMILGMVFPTATISSLSALSCNVVVWAMFSLLEISSLSISMFSAFRVYAISGRQIVPMLIVLILSAVTFVDNLVLYGGFATVELLPSPFNCSSVINISSQWTFRNTLICRICTTVAEVIVISITWRNRVHRPKMYHDEETLGSIFLRDGSLYFIVLALLNILQVILTSVSLDQINVKESYISAFLDPISSILICRFILNLRQVDHSRMNQTMSLGGDIHFAAQGSKSTLPRFVASFGELLHTASDGSEESYEVEEGEQHSASWFLESARQG